MSNIPDINYTIPSTNPTAPPSPEGRDDKLWQASLKFESVFIQQMMESMRKSVPDSGFMPKGFAEKSYQSMMDQAIADAGSQRGQLGIAASIYHQLKHDQEGGKQVAQAAVTASDKLTAAVADRYRSMADQGSK